MPRGQIFKSQNSNDIHWRHQWHILDSLILTQKFFFLNFNFNMINNNEYHHHNNNNDNSNEHVKFLDKALDVQFIYLVWVFFLFNIYCLIFIFIHYIDQYLEFYNCLVT